MGLGYGWACLAPLCLLPLLPLLHILPLLQVSARLVYGRDHLVKASHVRNPFTWRKHELARLKAIRVSGPREALGRWCGAALGGPIRVSGRKKLGGEEAGRGGGEASARAV